MEKPDPNRSVLHDAALVRQVCDQIDAAASAVVLEPLSESAGRHLTDLLAQPSEAARRALRRLQGSRGSAGVDSVLRLVPKAEESTGEAPA